MLFPRISLFQGLHMRVFIPLSLLLLTPDMLGTSSKKPREWGQLMYGYLGAGETPLWSSNVKVRCVIT